MTPEELATLRADYWDVDMRLRALCDALEAAWAEQEFLNDQLDGFREWLEREQERADRAEAAVERMDAQLGRMRYELHKFDPEWLDTEEDRWHPFEALARIRALCDVWSKPTTPYASGWYAAQVRAAIEGDNQ